MKWDSKRKIKRVRRTDEPMTKQERMEERRVQRSFKLRHRS